MSTRTILSWLLLLFGEAIIIAAFVIFRGNTPDNILIMNIVVTSIIYVLFYFNFRAPWIDLKDKSQKQIGAIGISWFVAWSYAIVAVVVMLAANLVFPIFTTQLIIHCVLLFFLFMGILLVRHSADKVKEVYQQETAHRSGVIEMKNAMRDLKNKMVTMNELPYPFTQQINTLEENLRFISPSNNQEAYGLERSFVETVQEVSVALSDFSMNEERINGSLKKLERIYQNRKEV